MGKLERRRENLEKKWGNASIMNILTLQQIQCFNACRLRKVNATLGKHPSGGSTKISELYGG